MNAQIRSSVRIHYSPWPPFSISYGHSVRPLQGPGPAVPYAGQSHPEGKRCGSTCLRRLCDTQLAETGAATISNSRVNRGES